MARIKIPHICLEIIKNSGAFGFSPAQTRGLNLGWGGLHFMKWFHKKSLIWVGMAFLKKIIRLSGMENLLKLGQSVF